MTRWNRHCTRLLQQLLPKLEEQLSSPPLHEHHSELNEITSTYKVSVHLTAKYDNILITTIMAHNLNTLYVSTQLTGFPIHLRYSDVDHITSTVERTAVHLCEDQRVEYALAVYVHPYPNDVISVWLYIASLVPK